MSHKKNSLLWEIVRNGHISHLYGTMHVRDRMAFRYIDGVQPYILQAQDYYGEINLEDARTGLQQDSFFWKPEDSLKSRLGPKKYAKASGILKKAFGLDLEVIDRFVPLIIINMAAESILSEDHQLSLDGYLWQYAKDRGCALHGLESVNEQSALLANIPMDLQLSQFLKLCRNVSSFRQNVIRITHLYREGNIHQLFKVSSRNLGKIKGPMIYHRNENMADRIYHLVTKTNCFFAVGAGHLGGKKGIIHLLRQKGCAISPVGLDIN